MTPVVLATDALLWLLVAAVAVYALYCRRRPHLAAPWKRVFQSKAAVASGVVLGFFLLVGLADSLVPRALGRHLGGPDSASRPQEPKRAKLHAEIR